MSTDPQTNGSAPDAPDAPDARDAHVAVQSGDGLVGRYGSAVVVLSTHDESAFTDALVRVLEGAERDQPSAEDLAWRLAGTLSDTRSSAPAFAVCAPTADGQLLLVHGAAFATAGAVTVTGRDALTWVDRVVTEPLEFVALTLDPSATVRPDPRSSLRSGLVPGSGVVIMFGATAERARAAEQPAQAPAPQPDEPASWRQTPADPPTEAMAAPTPAEPAASPLAQEPAPTPAEEATTSLPDILVGDLDDDHDDHPVQPEQPRAAVAALVSDDGSRTPLDRAYVFGREPQMDDAVGRGAAEAIVVTDPDNAISRVQTYLWVNDNGVFLRDAHSANGTFVAAPGAPEWDQIGEQPTQLPVGWSIRMGRRVFTHVAPGG